MQVSDMSDETNQDLDEDVDLRQSLRAIENVLASTSWFGEFAHRSPGAARRQSSSHRQAAPPRPGQDSLAVAGPDEAEDDGGLPPAPLPELPAPPHSAD